MTLSRNTNDTKRLSGALRSDINDAASPIVCGSKPATHYKISPTSYILHVKFAIMQLKRVVLVSSLLAMQASAYRLFFYVGPSCQGEQLGVVELSGSDTSTCHNDYAGVASSVLVKVDSPNDANNEVLFFPTDNCPLENVSGAIFNANRCVSVSGEGATDYATFKLVASGSSTGQAIMSSAHDELLNMKYQPRQDRSVVKASMNHTYILVPVGWGAFRRFDMTDLNEKGSLNDPYGLLNQWNGNLEPYFSSDGEQAVPSALNRRQFDPAQCQSAIDCLLNYATASTNQIQQLAIKAYNTLTDGDTWKSLVAHPLTVNLIGASYSKVLDVAAGGSQDNTTNCDETRNQTARGLMKDMLDAVTQQGQWSSFDETWCDNISGVCVDMVARVYEKNAAPKQSC